MWPCWTHLTRVLRGFWWGFLHIFLNFLRKQSCHLQTETTLLLSSQAEWLLFYFLVLLHHLDPSVQCCGKSGHSYLFPELRGKAFSLSAWEGRSNVVSVIKFKSKFKFLVFTRNKMYFKFYKSSLTQEGNFFLLNPWEGNYQLQKALVSEINDKQLF